MRSATPPLLATAHLSQSVHQDRVVQASQQLAAGHQAAAAAFSGQTSGSGSQLLGAAGSQQALGVGSQQTNGLGQGSSLQQVKAGGISPQQALSAVKAEPQSLAHSLQQQQQQQQRLLIPKMEVKSEIDLDQKVSRFLHFLLACSMDCVGCSWMRRLNAHSMFALLVLETVLVTFYGMMMTHFGWDVHEVCGYTNKYFDYDSGGSTCTAEVY